MCQDRLGFNQFNRIDRLLVKLPKFLHGQHAGPGRASEAGGFPVERSPGLQMHRPLESRPVDVPQTMAGHDT